jgi:integrase/recombinase XerC
MQKFLQYLGSEKRASDHTRLAYQTDLLQFQQFIRAHFEIENLLDATQMMVRSWVSTLMEQELSVSSVHRKLSSLQAYYKFELKEGRIQQNPVKGVAKPKRPSVLPQYLEIAQAEKIYQDEEIGWEGMRNLTILKLLYETGMRRSELLGIKEKDIDFSKGQVRVLGKRNKVRIIPISADLLEEIKALLVENKKSCSSIEDGGVFINQRGQVLSSFQLYTIVKRKLSQWTTMQKRSPHILRHSFASHLLNKGADLNVIKEILGHSSLAATQVYTHLNIEKLKGIHSLLHPRNGED